PGSPGPTDGIDALERAKATSEQGTSLPENWRAGTRTTNRTVRHSRERGSRDRPRGSWPAMVNNPRSHETHPMPLCEAEANTSASFGLIFLGLLAAVPGGLLLRGGTRRERDEELQEQMAGFVRSHEAFTLDELARHIGRPPAVTQTMLHRDIARYQLPLVMHRASGRYMRLDRLSRAASVADRCQSCGGSIDTQIVFEGERINCPYCGCVVQTHAPGTQPRTPAPAPAPAPTPTPWQEA